MRSRGFTLLEVMVAVAILGLALTVILSAQAGLYAAGTHAANETVAISMARCKMGEIEEHLLRNGYPELDQVEDGACCEDQTPQKISCTSKVERIELPEPASFGEENPAGDNASLDLSGSGSSPLPKGSGAFGALLEAGKNAKSGDDPVGGVSALASTLGEATGGGMAGIAPLVMGMVYPSFKPLFETSIRKLTVIVKWKEGTRERDLTVVQYVTNPMRGGFGLNMENADPDNPAGGEAFPPSPDPTEPR